VPVEAFSRSAVGIDLSGRVVKSSTVAASPSAATETTIASITLPTNVAFASGVLLIGFAAWTYGTSGVSANLKIRQTDTSGSTIIATGVTNNGAPAATQLDARTIVGFDTAPSSTGQVYVLTLTVGSAAAASTVSAVTLLALLI
jgi:hypothetical protein